MFPHGEEEENTIYLGGGAGYFSKTFTYSLFKKDDAVNFVKKYLEKTTPRAHNHFKDRGISPHMQKCTRCGGKLYEMGKCQIRIEEV
jgi:CRISPR-associated protein Csm5